MAALLLACAAFLGTHFALSHPLRDPLVGRMGLRGFLGFYTLIAFATLGAMIWAYSALGEQAPLWTPGDPLWALATVAMWFASVLLVGSFVGNPALPGARRRWSPAGVLAITRHPMMWSFAIWAAVHMAVVATPKALVLDGTILFMALVGSAGQDRKKARLGGAGWHDWAAQTAFVPFGRGLAWPGTFAFVGGTLLLLLATWAHAPLGGMAAGPWRWIG